VSSELYVGGSSGESASLDFNERSGRLGERRGLLGPARGWSSISVVNCRLISLCFRVLDRPCNSTFFSSSIADVNGRELVDRNTADGV
jgi:hypothetical protein